MFKRLNILSHIMIYSLRKMIDFATERLIPAHLVSAWRNSPLLTVLVVILVYAQGLYSSERIDFFDKSNNFLMFVTLSSDSSGLTSGRTVYMADSTFVRTTSIQRDQTGLITKEISFNTAGDQVSTTQHTTTSGKPTFSATDPFLLDQLGAPVSYSGDGTNFDIFQRGNLINKMRYSPQADGSLRIEVLDKAGGLLYYAKTNDPETGISNRQVITHGVHTSLRMIRPGRCRAEVNLVTPALVTLELFQLSGKRVAVLLKKEYAVGKHVLYTRTPTNVADGNYLLRLSINGKPSVSGSGLSPKLAKMAVTNDAQLFPPSLIFESLAINGDLETVQNPRYRSPAVVVASPEGKTLYVAEQTAKRIAVIDTGTRTVTSEILLPNEPTGIAISPDGSFLYVTCSSERWPAGMVCVINSLSHTITAKIAVGHSARSPVVSPDGTTLYVCNWFDNSISVVDLASGREMSRIPVRREPYAAAITPDGKTLVVTNSLPDEKATDTVNISCKISLINTVTRRVDASIALPVGSHSLFSICISPDGAYAYAAHLIGRMTIPATTLTGGWVHSNNLAIIDIAGRRLANDIELDDMNHGAANPWGVASTADGKFLCVVHAGSNEMTIVDLPAMMVKAKGTVNLSHDFTALQGIKRVTSIAGKGPRSLALVGTKAYVAGYFSDSLDIVNISLSGSAVGRIPLGSAKPMNSERKGEFLFGDASLCYQKWQSCASCHPFTRPDALNWILSQTVNNAPKNVKSMLYSFQTPPTNWSGRRTSAWESVRKGVEIELQTVPTEDIALPLDTFIMRLKPVPSPYLVKGKLSDAAMRGKSAFNKANCTYCHPRPLYTDMRKWNAGVQDPFDYTLSWDSPSLIEAWRTGPYDHLGSQLTLEDMVKVPGHSADAGKLTSQEFSDLIAFLKSL